MKKKYNAPTVEVVSVVIPAIMTRASLDVVGGSDPDNHDERGDFSFQGTDEFRSDWDNIWGNM